MRARIGAFSLLQTKRSWWIPVRWQVGVAFLAVLAVVTLVYWPGLTGPLLLDDVANLGPLISLDRAGALSLSAVLDARPDGLAARPGSMSTFYLEWLAHGGSVWHLKLTNLATHLVCGAMVFWLAGRLLQQHVAGIGERRWWVALWVAAAWLSAPLLVSTVLYIVQRMAQLSALFVLAGLLCYVIGRQRVDDKPLGGWLLIAASLVVCWPLAIACKENGAVLPLLLAAIEIFFFRSAAVPTRAGTWCRFILAGVIALPAVIVLAKISLDPQWLLSGYGKRDFTPYERVLTQARVLLDYAANLLVLPGGSSFGLFHDDLVKSRSLLDPITTVIALGVWATVLVVAWLGRGRRFGVVMFGPVFFLLAHLPEASILPLELYFEHRNYLPGVGLLIGLGIALAHLVDRARFSRTAWTLLALVPISYAALSANRVVLWQSWDDMLLAAEQTHPQSRRVHAGLAVMYMQRGDLAAMSEHLDYAGQLDRGRGDFGIAASYLIAYCLNQRPIPEAAYRRLERQPAITDRPFDTYALNWLTNVTVNRECPRLSLSRVVPAVHRVVSLRAGAGAFEGNADLHVDAARLLGLDRDYPTALGHLLVATALRPAWLEPRVLEAEYRLRMGMPDRARAVLQALDARPPHQLAPYLERLGIIVRALP